MPFLFICIFEWQRGKLIIRESDIYVCASVKRKRPLFDFPLNYFNHTQGVHRA